MLAEMIKILMDALARLGMRSFLVDQNLAATNERRSEKKSIMQSNPNQSCT